MFESILTDFFAYLLIAAIMATASFSGIVYRCVHKQAKRGYRQSQAILLLTKSIEEQTKQYHEDYAGDLYDQAEIILKDEKGEF